MQWVKQQEGDLYAYHVVVTEQDFPNTKKAYEYAESLGNCDCHIKIYDEDDQVIYDEKRGMAKEIDPELYA